MDKTYPLKVGLFSIGLDAYWDQFEGLEKRLKGYSAIVESKLRGYGAEVVNAGMVDTPAKALEAGHLMRQADVDIIFLYVTTYALSSTVLPVVQRAKVPVVVLNLSPTESIDYSRFNSMQNITQMTGEWLAYCSPCPVPEIANVFRKADISFFQVTGLLNGDAGTWNEIREWVDAARVAHTMSHNRLGLMGNYYGGMLDIYSDLTLHCARFGGHIEIVEVDELSALREKVGGEEIEKRILDFREAFEIQEDCSAEELSRAARTSLALDALVHQHSLGSLAYYHKGTGNSANEDTMSSMILGTSLLTGRHVPVAGEYEVKNVQAMKIMDTFGAGGSFTEYYAMDYKADVVLMGHDGPGHIAIAQGKTKVRPLQVYHGKVGRGLSVEMSVVHGPVTLLSVVEQNGTLSLLCAEGESVAGPILEIGNTNSRYKFSIGASNFMEKWNAQGPAHHCAVGIGHISSKIRKLGALLNIGFVQIC